MNVDLSIEFYLPGPDLGGAVLQAHRQPDLRPQLDERTSSTTDGLYARFGSRGPRTRTRPHRRHRDRLPERLHVAAVAVRRPRRQHQLHLDRLVGHGLRADDDLPFFKQSDHVGNVAVLYEKYGVRSQCPCRSRPVARVGWSRRGSDNYADYYRAGRLQGERARSPRPARVLELGNLNDEPRRALRRAQRPARAGRDLLVRTSTPASTGDSDEARDRLASSVGAALLRHAAPPTRQAPAASRHVILISIDGFAAFHLDNPALDLPNIRALAAAGVAAASSETVFPSLTHPSHTTLITGVTPREHGVVDNTCRRIGRPGERFHITNLPRRESIRVPTIFDAVHGGRTPNRGVLLAGDQRRSGDRRQRRGGLRRRRRRRPDAVAPGLLAELRAAGVPIDSYYAFYDDPFAQGAADIALTQAAASFKARGRRSRRCTCSSPTRCSTSSAPPTTCRRAALTTADYCVGCCGRPFARRASPITRPSWSAPITVS